MFVMPERRALLVMWLMVAILRGRQLDFVQAPRDRVVPIRLSTATVVVLPHAACAQDAAEKADAISFQNVVCIAVLLGSVAFTQLGQRISDVRSELKGELKGFSDELKGVKDSLNGLVVAIAILILMSFAEATGYTVALQKM